MAFTFTFLGTGTSQGVPVIGKHDYPPEFLDNPKNNRTRSSIFVETGTHNILVDTTPEMRIQSLREKIRRVDAIIITHPHADHIMGMDDCRRWCEILDDALPIYASPITMKILRQVYGYAFNVPPETIPRTYFKPRAIEFEAPVMIGETEITPLPVPHGSLSTYGLLFTQQGRKLLAYISDAKAVPVDVEEKIRGVEVVVLDALRKSPGHPTHMCLQEALEAASRIKARQTWFTHLTHEYDHDRDQALLPEGIRLAWDGLKISIQ